MSTSDAVCSGRIIEAITMEIIRKIPDLMIGDRRMKARETATAVASLVIGYTIFGTNVT